MTNWSKYQVDVFAFGSSGRGHAVVEAVAGSGKSTTGVELAQRMSGRGLMTTFTKGTINDLNDKIKKHNLKNVVGKTYNAFGAGIVYKHLKSQLLTEYPGQKTDVILRHDVLYNNEKLYFQIKHVIIRLVSLMKNLAVMSVYEAEDRYDQILEYYDIEQPKHKDFKAIFFETYNACLRRTDIMDFDDQKMFPVLFGMPIPQFDFMILDEQQDTCPIEAKLMFQACRDGRIITFGDSYQAIYSFKGTEPDSMKKFAQEYNATRLPLSISYRCSKNVILEAQKIVPSIEWAEGAIDGSVDTIPKEQYWKQVTDKDMVLARTTEDLARSAIKLLGDGRAAYIEGREYGTQLKDFVDKVCDGQWLTSNRFKELLDGYYNDTHAQLTAMNRENQLLSLESKYESICVLMIGCENTSTIKTRIDSIFTDSGVGVRHLTIHKSKGLESRSDGDVFVLRPDRLPHPIVKKEHLLEEEERLKYVAITRAKRGFYYVTKDKDER